MMSRKCGSVCISLHRVGRIVGELVGNPVGSTVGRAVGVLVGVVVGISVGAAVHPVHVKLQRVSHVDSEQ